MEQEEVFNLPQTPPLPVASWMLRHSTQLPSSSQLHCWSFFGIKFRGWWNIHLALASPCQVGNGGLIFPGTQKEVVFLSRSQDIPPHLLYKVCFSFLFFYFLWLHPQLMEVPGPGIESKLHLQQCWIFNPLCQARDGTHTSTATRAAAIGFLTHHAPVWPPKVYFSYSQLVKKQTLHASRRSVVIERKGSKVSQ